MPEYLAPGVYVEETSFRAKSIEGVGTSTTAFVGPTRKGPFRATTDAQEVPEMLTSFGDFERIYGGISDLSLAGASPDTNYLAHAVRAFFNEGGSRLYVSRVVGAGAAAASGAITPAGTAAAEAATFVARFPGSVGNGLVVVREVLTPVAATAMVNAPTGTLLVTGAAATTAFHLKVGNDWHPATDPAAAAEVAATLAADTPRIISLLVVAIDADGEDLSFEGLGFDRSHPAWVGHVMSATPARRADHLQNMFAITIGGTVSALELHTALFTGAATNAAGQLERSIPLTGGVDGSEPVATNYALALGELSGLEDISIVAAPGSSAYGEAQAINNLLIAHAESRRAYRIAVLDLPRDQTPGQARSLRGLIDSRYAAVYYPWVVVPNPLARPGREDIPRELALPPSGFVSGIYARNDVERGVWKAPANEVVRGALRFELDVNFAQQEMLNPLGVNCLRYLSGRGFRVWGARLASSDPEWKYVNVRRYFNYLESSIDRGTSGRCSSPTASGCGPTCGRRSPTSSTTSGATARCSAARPRKPISCAATAAP
jgi:phage tail sheath protein FI